MRQADSVVPPEPAPSQPGTQRIEQLDSLRGLAALIVLVGHSSTLYTAPVAAVVAVIWASPVKLLLQGHSSVLFFFLLSGFVLYLPYLRPQARPRYAPYLVRRVCRIYLPYVVGVAFAAVASYVVYRPVAGVTAVMGWHPVPAHVMVRNALLFLSFILPFDRDIWNGSTWSLAEEMRLSILFPLIAYAVRRFRAWHILAGVVVVTVGCAVAIGRTGHHFPFMTAHYAGTFAVGALLAKHHKAAARKMARLQRWAVAGLFVAALLVFTYGIDLGAVLPKTLAELVPDLLITVGNCVLLIAALALVSFRRMLLLAPVQVLGRTSYSFYLLHMPVLFACVCVLGRHGSWLVLVACALPLTTVLALVSYRWVELPCVALGKRLTAGMARG